MRKIRWLGISVIMALVISFGIGTMASAEKASIEMVPQKVELESFLERVINVEQWDYLGIDKSETLETLWVVKLDEVIKEGSYIIEFVPGMIQISEIAETGVYFVTMWIDGALLVTPEDNARTGGKITLSVEVTATTPRFNPKETLEFLGKILKAQKGNEKISMEVEIAFASSILVDEERLEEENFPKFKVSFYNKK